MTTIQVIRRRSGFVNVCDFYWLRRPGEVADEHNLEELHEYLLPPDYRIGKTVMDETAIFDQRDRHCVIAATRDGHAQLVSAVEGPVLERVDR